MNCLFNFLTEMDYSHLFKLLLVITILTSVFAIGYSDEITNSSSENLTIKNFIAKHPDNVNENLTHKVKIPWDKIKKSGIEIGKQISKEVIRDVIGAVIIASLDEEINP